MIQAELSVSLAQMRSHGHLCWVPASSQVPWSPPSLGMGPTAKRGKVAGSVIPMGQKRRQRWEGPRCFLHLPLTSGEGSAAAA